MGRGPLAPARGRALIHPAAGQEICLPNSYPSPGSSGEYVRPLTERLALQPISVDFLVYVLFFSFFLFLRLNMVFRFSVIFFFCSSFLHF
jgi:hypothetical protein